MEVQVSVLATLLAQREQGVLPQSPAPEDVRAPDSGHRKKADPTPELHKVSLELGTF